MSLMQHYDKVITRMQLDICRLIEEKAEIEANVEMLIAIRDQARLVHATGAGTYNDKRTSVDRKKLSTLGLMVKESYKTIPGEMTVDITAWTLALKLTPFNFQKIKPYVIVGGGIMHASADATVSIPGASASSSDDETDICGKIGLGVDYFVTDKVAIGLEGAYWAGFNDLDNIRFYTVTAGVAYHF